jgi:hypothetical protein
MRKAVTAVGIAGSLLAGGAAGYTQLGPTSAEAVTKTAQQSSPTQEATEPHRGGHQETVSDQSVVAKAIGISEADLSTALGGGQTIAQVAAAHNVTVQKVIDALVADGNSELAAEVSSGQLTQAQADQMKAEITQRAADQVNGSFDRGGDHGGPETGA